MKIRFIKPIAGRAPGTVEDNPDDHLCQGWIDKGFAVREDEPESVPNRTVDKPARDRALKSKKRG